MTLEDVANTLLGNVPDPNLLILCASGKVVAIRAETHTADIKIACLARVFVNQHASLRARLGVIDLRGSVAARCEVFAVCEVSQLASYDNVPPLVPQSYPYAFCSLM